MSRSNDRGRLAGQVALITGAAHGLGRAIAERFATEGARVVAADIDSETLDAFAAEQGGAVKAAPCDVTDPEAMRSAVALAVDTFGGLDILVNNVGGGRGRTLVETEPKHWRRAMSLNLDSAFYGIRYAAPMLADGGGAILNVSSAASRRPSEGLAAYSVAKAGIEALTKAAALELRPQGIRVNAIVPGLFSTAAAHRSRQILEQGYGSDLDKLAERRQGRWGRPEEAAAVAVHLTSDEASFTTGLLYILDHGFTLT